MEASFFSKVFGWLRKKTSEETEEIERELPYALMMFTMMAASGISIYESWKRMRKISILKRFQKEAEEVVRQVEVLGKDPLTAMYDRAEKTDSKLYRDFLSGFVSSLKSGGKVVDYLKSKLRSIFELRNNAIVRSVEKIGTLVEAYAVMLIVAMCVYILYIVLSSTAMMELLAKMRMPVMPYLSYLVVLFIMPLISIMFMALAHNTHRSTLMNLKDVYKKAILPISGAVIAVVMLAFIPSLNLIVQNLGWPLIATIILVFASLPSAIHYYKIAKANYIAESSLPSFIRDVTEARKIGLSPEKSIIHATKRKDYRSFSKILSTIRSQIEWGVPLRKVFNGIKRKIQSWPVLVNFLVMIEAVEIGGAPSQALEVLSEYCEKEREVEVNKCSLLKPYIILSVIWSVLMALTTTVVAITMYVLTQLTIPNLSPEMLQALVDQINVFSTGIIFQCWISGFFIGKISEGNFAAGFKYSALLAVTAYVSWLLSQNFLWSAYAAPS